jgi:hypothetical protein
MASDDASELDFAIRYYRGEVFREWLSMLFSTGYGHGSDLVMALGSPRGDRPGLSDNVYAADKFLRAAVGVGWIVQSEAPRPTPQQRFFDVENNLRGKGPKYPRFHCYAPNPFAVAAMDFIRGGLNGRAAA